MAEGLRFEVLGPVRAWRDGTEIDLGSPQQRAILAILLLQAGTTASPEQLISAIWSGAAPRAAVGMVRSYVSRLRRVLPAGVIESVGGGYVLRAGEVDAAEFHRQLGVAREARRAGDEQAVATALRAALRLWHGTPLAGVNGDYAEAERTRLGQLRLTVIEDLAAADIESGRHVEAAAELADVIAEDPLRERPRELLMLALYRSGRQAEALEIFTQVRHLLHGELGLEPGPDLREMQRRILAADPTLMARVEPAPAPPPRLPTQLPPDLRAYVGREHQLTLAVDALTPSDAGVPMIGIEGLAGIGKTTFAVHIGHAVVANYPDGQLFVDLGAADDPLAEVLRGIGVPDADLPRSFSERVTLWRTLTTGRRLLIVLDDAGDDEQVRPLLPGSGGSAVVITARRRLYGLAYVHWMKLDGLHPDDSVRLLELLIGADRVRPEVATVRDLVRRTAGLPQVLQAVGARIAARPAWTMADAMQRLGRPEQGSPDSPPECEAIERPYESVLAQLSAPQARAFRLLALADGPDIPLAAAAAALNLPIADTARLLESLVDIHLLETGGLDRYYYQEPLRVFARGRAQIDDESQAALTRLVRFYSSAKDRLPSGA